MTTPSVPPTRGEAEKARREARQAAALRENLRRRKQQVRLRTDVGPPQAATVETVQPVHPAIDKP